MNPYVILAAVGIWLGSAVGGYFYGTHHEGLKWKAALAEQQRDAEKLRADINAANAAKDAASAEYARNLDERAKHETDVIAATAADYQRQLTDRVRDAERRARGRCPVPGTTADPSRVADASGAGDVGLPLVDTGKLQRAADGAEALKVVIRTCVDWAAKNGR